MRRLVVIGCGIALMALMCFSVGCRLFGGDDDEEIRGTGTATISGNVTLPASASAVLAGSVRGAVSVNTLFARLADTAGNTVGSTVQVANGKYEFSGIPIGTHYVVQILNSSKNKVLLKGFIKSLTTTVTQNIDAETTARTVLIEKAGATSVTVIDEYLAKNQTEIQAVISAIEAALSSDTGFRKTDGSDSTDILGVQSVIDETGTVVTSAQSYASADATNGGRLYDKFWASEIKVDSNSKISANSTTISAKGDFFRCKQCHGWDLKGRTGGYANRAPKTSRPNVSSVNLSSSKTKDPLVLFNLIKGTGMSRRSLTADLSTYNPPGNVTVGDQMPDFSEILSDAQIWDLVKFLKEGSVDVTQLYDATVTGAYPAGSVSFSNLGKGGDATAGKSFFASKCATCHGSDGTKVLVDGGEYTIGRHVRSKPYEDQHKVKFGHLGSSMTGFPTVTLTELKNLFAAMADTTAFPSEQPLPGYSTANAANGARLYDKFWASEVTSDSNSKIAANEATFSAKSDFFRCKQCHGWDLKGQSGAYINRGPKTSRPNVSSVDLSTYRGTAPETLFNLIKGTGKTRRSLTADLSTYSPPDTVTVGDQMPDFSAILSDAQIWDLVKFLKEGSVDVTQLYDSTFTGTYPTGSVAFSNIGKDGDATAGKSYFASKCASCHGSDGTRVLVDGGAYTVGRHVRSKPYEDQHKVKFGHLGSAMTGYSDVTLTELKSLYVALTDTTAFPDEQVATQTTPTTPDGATLYSTNCSGCHGALASSEKKSATSSQIQGAISSNTGGMGSFSNLSTAEIEAIAKALQ